MYYRRKTKTELRYVIDFKKYSIILATTLLFLLYELNYPQPFTVRHPSSQRLRN
jgi:hypothetical protein